ncbi:hypothetical protein SAMN05192583_0566 [Sphingomonas gellani]|uniref:Uncharacterized protein n=1 Tax=Sphingomonas gellani TaxID=1166340 RepID=A0A1H7Z712_9SPHN|nr:hypothetical protein [Sphingomonas gellani]SEM54230.1 hypothetical protein SAMN05192583_0566 [Sphingomonas gellani]
MTPDEQAEIVALQRQMHAYFDSLTVAGINPAIIATAALTAASERVLVASTPTQTAAWLRGQALAIEKFGAEMLRELSKG